MMLSNIKPLLNIAVLLFACSMSATSQADGTFLKPFASNALWNSKPVNPQFSNFQIPLSQYYPAIQQGAYSTGVYEADVTDSPMTVYPYANKSGVWDPDSEAFKSSIIIPRWPQGVIPASGSDGHADVVDSVTGIVHSFFQLKQVDGVWQATQYAWTKLDGRGWGDPAHYFQGARAAAVPAFAGIIRQHEIEDGKQLFEHALAMSLTFNALSASPSHIFPATSGDGNAATTNSGEIPEGALMMLPPTFDVGQLQNPKLIKVANTLKQYGAYVVDRNYGTPYVIYVENGPIPYSLRKPDGSWDNQAANELQIIRAALRQVSSADGWQDAEGQLFDPKAGLNIMSMREYWHLMTPGATKGVYDTWRQAVVFGKTTQAVTQIKAASSSITRVYWANPKLGETYELKAHCTNGAKLRLQLKNKTTNAILYDSNLLQDGDSVVFNWPANELNYAITAISGVADESSVSGSLIKVVN